MNILLFIIKMPAFILYCATWMLSELFLGLSIFFDYLSEILEEAIDE